MSGLRGLTGVLSVATVIGATGCGGDTTVPLPIAVECIEGQAIVSTVLDLVGLDLPFNSDFVGTFKPRGPVAGIHFEALRLRSVDSAEAALSGTDLTRALLGAPGRFSSCEGARPNVGWIKEMTVYIQAASGGTRARLAHYRRAPGAAPANTCGVAFEVDSGVDMRDYLPKYRIEVEASASAPPQRTCISGLTVLRYVTGL